MTPPRREPEPSAPNAADWALLALVCACQLLAGLLELLFLAQFYLGTTIVPIVIVVALVANVALPSWGMRIVSRTSGAVLPVVAWLVPLLGLTMYTRPEGDLFVLGADQQQYAYYGLLLVGAVAGFTTIVVGSGRPPAAPAPNRVTRLNR